MSRENKEQFKVDFSKRMYGAMIQLINLVNSLPEDALCSVIKNQLMRSGTSIGANYFEARVATSRKDFINYFSHSLKSANESKFWIFLLMDVNKCDKELANNTLSEVMAIANILAASIITMKGKRNFNNNL